MLRTLWRLVAGKRGTLLTRGVARLRPRRLSQGIEPLERRQLLAIDPGLGGLAAGNPEAPQGGAALLLDEPPGIKHMLFDEFGGTYADAEKIDSPNDSAMCWAAAASNVLEWTDWGKVAGMTTTDDMFQYFKDHFTNDGGSAYYGWEWWFDGTYEGGGAHEDVEGGGFFPNVTFASYSEETFTEAGAMSLIAQYVEAGSGITIGVEDPQADPPVNHALTVWGYNVDAENPDNYLAIWVTDSDDSKFQPDPPDLLKYYYLSYDTTNDHWDLLNYGGSSTIHISSVSCLKRPDLELTVDANSPGGNGMDNGATDTFVIQTNGDQVEVYIDGNLSTTTWAATLRRVVVQGSDDVDVVNMSNLIAPKVTTVVDGRGANDTITGSPQADLIYGGLGRDSIIGNAGDDTIYGGDTAIGGDDSDTITGDADNDSIYGNDGNDSLLGGTGDDTIYGEGDNDRIWGNVGNDTIYGGSGNDTIYGNEDNDFIHAGYGNDYANGDAANDTIWGDQGNDTLYGSAGNDLIHGDEAIEGFYGNDIIDGGVGNDTLYGDRGTDVMYGGAQDDLIFGNEGRPGWGDTIYGNDGADTIFGDSAGQFAAGEGDSIKAGAGNDTVYGEIGFDSIWGDEGNDLLYGNAGNDVIHGDEAVAGFYGNDTIDGGDDPDTLYGDRGADIVYGGAGNDRILGNEGNTQGYGDSLYENDGNDTIYGDNAGQPGVGGFDYLEGGAGNDCLFGETGNDCLLGQEGDDTLNGGDDSDVYRYQGTIGQGSDLLTETNDSPGDYLDFQGFGFAVTVDLNVVVPQTVASSLGQPKLIITLATNTLIENVLGTTLDDTIWGNAEANYVYAYAGADVLHGRDGNDTLYGVDGTDLIYGEAGNDSLYGGNHNDTIFGGDGNDRIYGDANNDSLCGDNGDDTIYGGTGNDSLFAGMGTDKLYGNDGDDLMYINDGTGGDTADGGAGTDTVHYDPGDTLINCEVLLQGFAAPSPKRSGPFALNAASTADADPGGTAPDAADQVTPSHAGNVLSGALGDATATRKRVRLFFP